MKHSWVLLVLLTFFLSNCVPLTLRTRFDRIGEARPALQIPIRPLVRTADDIKVFYGMAPKGLALKDQELKVEDGFRHRIVGQIRVLYDKGFCDIGHADKNTVIQKMQQEALAQGANAVVYAYSALPEHAENRDKCTEQLFREGFGRGWAVILHYPNA